MRALLFAAAVSLPAQQVVEVFRATEGTTVRTMDGHCRAIAALPDGALFTVVAESRRAAAGLERQRLRLLASADGGRTWRTCSDWPTGSLAQASLLADPDPAHRWLHVVYSTRDCPSGALALACRTWDAAAAAWQADPVPILVPESVDDQFQVADVEALPDGTLLATAAGFAPRQPRLGRYPAVLFIRLPGEARWQSPRRINAAPEGGVAQIVAAGSRIVFAYRTGHSLLPLRFRAMVPGSLAFAEAETTLTDVGPPVMEGADIPTELLEQLLRRPLQSPRAMAVVADADGRLRLLHALTCPLGSELRLVAEPEASPRHETVAADVALPLQGEDFQHFALARGPGAELYAIYSRLEDGHATLWWRRFGDDLPSEPRLVATGPPGAFARVNAFRSAHLDCTLFAVASGAGVHASGTRVVAAGVFPARTTRAVQTPRAPGTGR